MAQHADKNSVVAWEGLGVALAQCDGEQERASLIEQHGRDYECDWCGQCAEAVPLRLVAGEVDHWLCEECWDDEDGAYPFIEEDGTYIRISDAPANADAD